MGTHYFVANYTVTDADGYGGYRRMVHPMLAAVTGAVGPGDALEGEPGARTMLLEFDSREAFERWYFSPEHQEILPLRTDNSEGWALVIEQVS